jgi:hypothetical protein
MNFDASIAQRNPKGHPCDVDSLPPVPGGAAAIFGVFSGLVDGDVVEGEAERDRLMVRVWGTRLDRVDPFPVTISPEDSAHYAGAWEPLGRTMIGRRLVTTFRRYAEAF